MSIKVIVAGLLTVSAMGAHADEFDALRAALKSNGIGFYKPVNSVYGPGWVFVERTDAQGNKFPYTICRDAYAGVANAVIERGVIIPEGQKLTTSDISFGLSLLEKLMRNVASATIGLKRNGATSVEITWGPVSLIELSERNRADDTSRQVSQACAKNATAFTDAKGKFREKVYLVVRAAGVRQLTYSFARGKNATTTSGPSGSSLTTETNINLDAKELFTVTAGIKFATDSKTAFTVDVPADAAPIYVGANAVRILNWENLNAADQQAKLKLDAADSASSTVFEIR